MHIMSLLFMILWILVAIGLTTVIVLVFLGRRLYYSWKKPYKRATESLVRVSNQSYPFLNEFSRSALFRQWMRTDGMQDVGTLTVLFSASDDVTKGYIISSLSKEEQKRLHSTVRHKRSFTKEDVDQTVSKLHDYMEEEYYHPTKKHDLSFYRLFFFDEYAEVLSQIGHYKKVVNITLQHTIDEIVTSVMQSIPYYRANKMYEQQHKYEMFLTKDLPNMLELISQLPPSQRLGKEQELAVFLKEFQEALKQAEMSIYESVEDALHVKIRTAREKLYQN
ncbi:DUF3974 domain-containing protein [Ectobacillus polymachus]|uniref:DUF3974 domain-containing protein n=1 Tax=Ectobacillus polymachus TaxID=1508806 RepID=UPI003A85C43C